MLHAPARFKIMVFLAATTVSTFNEIARVANLTPGNLASHVKALEAAGYVESYRAIVDLKPRQRYRLTTKGRDALRAYSRALQAAVQRIERLDEPPADEL